MSEGFFPFSHILINESSRESCSRKELLAGYIGKKMRLKIIELEAEKEKIIFSKRASQSDNGSRKKLLSNLIPGQIVKGMEGLIHRSSLNQYKEN